MTKKTCSILFIISLIVMTTSASAEYSSNLQERISCYDLAVYYCEANSYTDESEDACYDVMEGWCRKKYPPDND